MDTQFSVFPFADGYMRVRHEAGTVTELRWLGMQCEDFGTPSPLTETVARQLAEYLEGTRKVFDFPIAMRGTSFQEKVWNALLSIPYGETRTYGEIAAAIGSPKAARAVGMACNRNPLLIAVPCHRVVGSNGSLTGYACGLELKKRFLELERLHKGK